MSDLITVAQIAELFREIDFAKYIFYSIWALPIFRVYRALTQKGSLKIWLREKSIEKNYPEYTVLIPARNSMNFIGEVIKSVLNQDVKANEIVVIDDFSIDDTFGEAVRTVESLGARLEDIEINGDKVVKKTYTLNNTRIMIESNLVHLGKARSLNHALKEVGGAEYILVLDSDTIIEKSYIKKLLDVISNNFSAGAASGITLLWKPSSQSIIHRYIAKSFRESSFIIFALLVKTAETKMNALATLSGCSLLVRKKALIDAGGFPEKTFSEDAELTLRLNVKGYKLFFVPEAISYTIDPGDPIGLFKKFYRVTKGTFTSFFRVLPSMVLEKNWRTLVTALYNVFGGIPLALSILNLFATMILAIKGYLGSSSLLYLASLFQFTSISMILNLISKYPLILMLAAYFWGVIGAVLSLLFVAKLYDKRLSRIALSALKYSFFVPIILWFQALIAIPAIIGALKDLLLRKNAKW